MLLERHARDKAYKRGAASELVNEYGRITSQSLGPFPVTVGLPPMRVISIDDVENVAPLKRDSELVARNVEVVVWVV